MTKSLQLLGDYARNASEEAFRELVSRYLALVYSTAVRLTGGDSHLAEDVAQIVFVDLARKACVLPADVMLGGWLHRHTCFVAAKTMRGERRRHSRERHFVEMNLENPTDLAPAASMLDDAINQLNGRDRSAILLRFFEQRDFRAVGEALGSNEDAARMRVKRALEKLHLLLKRRGVTLSAAALGTALAADAVTAAPSGLAVAISSAALSGAAAGSGTLLTTLKIMASTNFKLAMGALALAGVTTALLMQHNAELKLRGENEALRRQLASLQASNSELSRSADKLKSRLAAQSAQNAAQAGNAASGARSANAWVRFNDSTPKLTAAQADAYLKANGRKSANLLAAYRTSGDPKLLKEAMEKFPDDPQVAFEAVISADLSNDERSKWAKSLEQSDPKNALANYLSAYFAFSSGQTENALQELSGASGKTIQDYSINRILDDEDVYQSAGYSAAEAETASSMSLLLGQLAPMKQVGLSLVALASTYNQSGDPASAQAALQTALTMAQQLQSQASGVGLITPLVGMAVERIALNGMDPNAAYGDNGQTVQDQINALTQSRQAISDLVKQVEPLMPDLTDQELADYTNRRMVFGEFAAMQWLVSKYGQQ